MARLAFRNGSLFTIVWRFAPAYDAADHVNPRRSVMTSYDSSQQVDTTSTSNTTDRSHTTAARQPNDRLVEAPLRQVLPGLSVPSQSTPTSERTPAHARCFSCDTRLQEGAVVTALACRRSRAHGSEWSIARTYCPACAPTRCPQPTRGVVGALVTGTLGLLARAQAQRHTPCLIDLELRAVRSTEAEER